MQEGIKAICLLLLAVGIIFGSFAQWTLEAAPSFGWSWFINMLWFAIGFPVLMLIGYAIFLYGFKKLEEKK